MTEIKEFDLVEVTKDIPEKGIKAGMRGSVIDIHTKPCLGYEVEFNDEFGQPVVEAALMPDQVMSVAHLSREDYIKQGRSRLYLMEQPKK